MNTPALTLLLLATILTPTHANTLTPTAQPTTNTLNPTIPTNQTWHHRDADTLETGPIDIRNKPNVGKCAGTTTPGYNSHAPRECESIIATLTIQNLPHTGKIHAWAILEAPDHSKRYPIYTEKLHDDDVYLNFMWGKCVWCPELSEPGTYKVHAVWESTTGISGKSSTSFVVVSNVQETSEYRPDRLVTLQGRMVWTGSLPFEAFMLPGVPVGW